MKLNYYKKIAYDTVARYITYREAIHAVKKHLERGSILEVGVGNSIVSQHLKSCGYDVTTFDHDPELNPNVDGDLCDINSFFEPDSFDVVMAFQVLEHLPLEKFEPVMRELGRIAREKVIISLPDVRPYFQIVVHTPFFQRFLKREYVSLSLKIPRNRGKVVGVGDHYWEIGSLGVTPQKILGVLKSVFSNVEVKTSMLDRMHTYYTLEVE